MSTPARLRPGDAKDTDLAHRHSLYTYARSALKFLPAAFLPAATMIRVGILVHENCCRPCHRTTLPVFFDRPRYG